MERFNSGYRGFAPLKVVTAKVRAFTANFDTLPGAVIGISQIQNVEASG